MGCLSEAEPSPVRSSAFVSCFLFNYESNFHTPFDAAAQTATCQHAQGEVSLAPALQLGTWTRWSLRGSARSLNEAA